MYYCKIIMTSELSQTIFHILKKCYAQLVTKKSYVYTNEANRFSS